MKSNNCEYLDEQTVFELTSCIQSLSSWESWVQAKSALWTLLHHCLGIEAGYIWLTDPMLPDDGVALQILGDNNCRTDSEFSSFRPGDYFHSNEDLLEGPEVKTMARNFANLVPTLEPVSHPQEGPPMCFMAATGRYFVALSDENASYGIAGRSQSDRFDHNNTLILGLIWTPLFQSMKLLLCHKEMEQLRKITTCLVDKPMLVAKLRKPWQIFFTNPSMDNLLQWSKEHLPDFSLQAFLDQASQQLQAKGSEITAGSRQPVLQRLGRRLYSLRMRQIIPGDSTWMLLLERVVNLNDRVEKRLKQANLGNREIEVCLLLKRGMHPKEIATLMDISYNTVRNHLSHIYEKLHVSSRSQLLALLSDGTGNVIPARFRPHSYKLSHPNP